MTSCEIRMTDNTNTETVFPYWQNLTGKIKQKDFLCQEINLAEGLCLCTGQGFHKLDEILQYRLHEDTKSKLTEIKEQLRLYEDEAAEQLLRELITQIEKEDL